MDNTVLPTAVGPAIMMRFFFRKIILLIVKYNQFFILSILLSGYTKEFKFDFPADIEKGSCSATTYFDYSKKKEIQTAELEFTVKE